MFHFQAVLQVTYTISLVNSYTESGNGPLSTTNPRPNVIKSGTVGIGINNSASKQLLFEISEITKQVGIQLEKVYWEQKTITNSIQSHSTIPLDSFTNVDSQQKKMKEAIEWGDRELNKLLDSTYLDPIDIHNLLFLQQDLFLFAKQLEIYVSELQNIQKGTFLPRFCSPHSFP